MLTIVAALSLGGGFAGGYSLHAWKGVEPATALRPALSDSSATLKPYERLVEEAENLPAGLETPLPPIHDAAALVIYDETPMDGLIGGCQSDPEIRPSNLERKPCGPTPP